MAKLELLKGYRSRDSLAWDNPRLQLVDLQYSNVRPNRGLYNRLAARGRATAPRSHDRLYRRRRCPVLMAK